MKLYSAKPKQTKPAKAEPDWPESEAVEAIFEEAYSSEAQAPAAEPKKRKKRPLWQRLFRFTVVLAVLFGLYLTAVFSNIPFIARWRTIYIQTAMATMRHQWLATYFIPGFVIDEVMDGVENARQGQIGVNSMWDQWDKPDLDVEKSTITTRNPTLKNTIGMTKDEIDFFNDFWEIDVPSFLAYVEEHPETVSNGWDQININEAGRDDSGTTIYTQMDEQVLAVNAKERILIVREQGSGFRGLLVVAKDPSRLSVQESSQLGYIGERCGEIAAAHNGIIGMTASGFLDDGGVGDGAEPVGYAMCNGHEFGKHMPVGFKRLELHEDDRMYIRDAQAAVSPDTTDAVEFSPAMIVDGEILIEGGGWGWSDLQPRACMGQSENGEIIMLLIEGRRPGLSIGLSVQSCAELMLQHKCVQAMNLDGGTSAMIWYDGEYIMESSNPVMVKGRNLPNAFVYERAE